MIEDILEITTTNDTGKPLSIKVTAEEEQGSQPNSTIGILKVKLIADGDPVGTITFDPSNDTLQISGMNFSVAGYTTCLVTCGLGHLVSDILDCRKRGHTSAKNLIACLKRKGHGLSRELINCAISCLSAALTP